MVAEGRQRIDKWLFFARVVKSRALAAKLVHTGRVRVNGSKVEQASHALKPGDVLTLTLDQRILVCRLVGCGRRRGPAEEARLLYEDLSQAPDSTPGRLPDAIEPLRQVRVTPPAQGKRNSSQ